MGKFAKSSQRGKDEDFFENGSKWVNPPRGRGRPRYAGQAEPGTRLWLFGQRLPELNLVSIRVIDPGKAAVGFIHSLVVNLYALLFQAVEQSVEIVDDVVDHERGMGGAEIVSGGGKHGPDGDVFLLRVVVFAPRKHRASALVSQSKMLRIPIARLIAIRGFEEDTADSQDAAALLGLDRRLRLFRLRRLRLLCCR